jgi:hypothetical protein
MVIEVTLRRVSLTSIIRRRTSRPRSRESGGEFDTHYDQGPAAVSAPKEARTGITGKNRSCSIRLACQSQSLFWQEAGSHETIVHLAHCIAAGCIG